MPLPLSPELAAALAGDDGFRDDLGKDPAAVLAKAGVSLRPEQIPATVVLPSKEVCARKLLAPPPQPRGPGAPAPSPPDPRLVKRPALSFFFLRDEHFLDPELLLRGELSITRASRTVAVDLLAQAEHVVDDEELMVLLGVPSTRWITVDSLVSRLPFASSLIEGLLARGLLLSSRDEPRLALLRRRDEQLVANRWDPYAALYHYMARWHGQGLSGGVDWWSSLRRGDVHRECLARDGNPPGPFHTAPNARSTIELPCAREADPRFELLRGRRTTRVFDRRRSLTVDELSTILFQVYGCHGMARDGEVVALKKTSPSGGGLHPIEVYPLVLRVRGLRPGLYHYHVGRHALEVIAPASRREAAALATELTAGQSYFSTAHVLFILTARFYRNFWKYSHHKKAYKVLLLDAAHLSQTFYLVCSALGLGAFFTAAINEVDIEERLGLDGFEEGPIAISGCGRRLAKGSGLTMPVEPYAAPRS